MSYHYQLGGHTLEVEYSYHPASRGMRDGQFGPPIEPDEPAYIEVHTIHLGEHDITNLLEDLGFNWADMEEEIMATCH